MICGVDHHESRFTKKQIVQIRKMYHEENLSQRELGDMFGVSHSCIGLIVSGKTYSDLPGPRATDVKEKG
jgi:predicted transcriptional regulator